MRSAAHSRWAGSRSAKSRPAGVLARWPDRQRRVDRRRPLDDVADLLAVEESERIGKHDAADALARGLGRTRHDHAAARCADQHGILEVVEEQQLRDLLAMGLGRDAGTHLRGAFAAAIERRSQDVVAFRAQPLGNELPDPTALIGAVNENDVGHVVSLLAAAVMSAIRPSKRITFLPR